MKKKHISIIKLLPNVITLSSLCFGVLAVYQSIMMQWDRACLCIIIAAILDTMDGSFARMLNANSNFGMNLDSLCDFANYTIFPAMIMYNWSLWSDGIIGWSPVMVSAVCGAIRLARFNVKDSVSLHGFRKRFFCGIPSPAGGILIIFPLILQVTFGSRFHNFSLQYMPYYVYEIYIYIVALLMVSTLPTLSLKHIRIPKQYSFIALLCTGLIIVSFFILRWEAIVLYTVLYVLLMPFVLMRYRYLSKNHNLHNVK